MAKFPMGWPRARPGAPRSAATASAIPTARPRPVPRLLAMTGLRAVGGHRSPVALGLEIDQGAPRLVGLEHVEGGVDRQGAPEVVARGGPMTEPALDQPGVEEHLGVPRAKPERLRHRRA